MEHKLVVTDTRSIYVIRPRWYDTLESPLRGMYILRSPQTIVELDDQSEPVELEQELHLNLHECLEYLFNLWLQVPHEELNISGVDRAEVAIVYSIFHQNLLNELERHGIKFFDVESVACGATYIALKLNSRRYQCPSQS